MPMLTIFRRHLSSCEHAREGRGYRRCSCPIHVEGLLGGKRIRQTLGTRNWQRAQTVVASWEAAGCIPSDKPKHPPVEECCKAFTQDAVARGLASATLKKYRVLLDQWTAFAKMRGIVFLSQVGLTDFREFRESWTDGPISSLKKLERLRAVCRFFHDHGWIAENFAAKLRPPKVNDVPTLPFTRDEVVAILGAIPKVGVAGPRVHDELTALVLLLRYSGLRLGDAVTLRQDRLDVAGRRLMLYMHKTRVPVYVPLTDATVARLLDVRRPNGYFFCTGQASAATDAANWRRRLRKVFEKANLSGAHAHRFRDTFAVELLLAGVSLSDVGALLGHRSIRITEKHYAPWVLSRQVQLEAAVTRALENEVGQKTNHTQDTHGKAIVQ